jgi:hypothetical protein
MDREEGGVVNRLVAVDRMGSNTKGEVKWRGVGPGTVIVTWQPLIVDKYSRNQEVRESRKGMGEGEGEMP